LPDVLAVEVSGAKSPFSDDVKLRNLCSNRYQSDNQAMDGSVKFRKRASMGVLSECLERLKELREQWRQDKEYAFRGEEQQLWFRGHLDADWKLTPKLYRRQFSGADENEIRHEFQSRALQLVQGRLPANKWEWYFLMQHYGVPTRLLDWTENALVALYFAVENHPIDRDAAIWVLDPTWLNLKLRRGIDGAMLHDWSEAQSYLPDLEEAFAGRRVRAALPAAIEPPHVDRRLAAQSSRFVIFGTTRDLMRTKAARKNDRRVGMIRILKGTIENLQNDLNHYGITPASVFPDLVGLCQEISSKWRKA
jgi:hypothetical protein